METIVICIGDCAKPTYLNPLNSGASQKIVLGSTFHGDFRLQATLKAGVRIVPPK